MPLPKPAESQPKPADPNLPVLPHPADEPWAPRSDWRRIIDERYPLDDVQ